MRFFQHFRKTVEIPADTCAATVFHSLNQPGQAAILLESQEIGHARYSRMSIAQLFSISCQRNRLTLSWLDKNTESIFSNPVFINQLQQISPKLQIILAPNQDLHLDFPLPPSGISEEERLHYPNPLDALTLLSKTQGLTLYGGFGYDFIDSFEILPPPAPSAFPNLLFYASKTELVIDHIRNTAAINLASSNDIGDAEESTAAQIRAVLEEKRELPTIVEAVNGASTELKIEPEINRTDFAQIVEKLQEYIDSGDIYQVVPSRGFRTVCPDTFSAYLYLRAQNPSPYLFYADFGEQIVFGASPESNIKVDISSRKVAIRPIAGTMPRAFDEKGNLSEEQDLRHQARLRCDSKEIAEHMMLIDLARNDLARICESGTRKVTQLLNIELYSRVMHLVSQVEGVLRSDCSALDAYRACMNMGTLTGAPKLRATELLREVEPVGRGIYGGAIGYLDSEGNFDTAIAIRCAQVDQQGRAVVRAGAGVVRDSNPLLEADETFHKASAVLKAIATAQGKKMKTGVKL